MRASKVMVADVTFVADLSGALFWQEQRLLVVSDLHLEKGSSFAARGVLLPPYDTVATLSRLAAVIARHDPRRDRKSTRLNSSHITISYAVFCLKKKSSIPASMSSNY